MRQQQLSSIKRRASANQVEPDVDELDDIEDSYFRPSAEIRVKIGHRGNRQKQEKRFLSVLCGYISQISDIL